MLNHEFQSRPIIRSNITDQNTAVRTSNQNQSSSRHHRDDEHSILLMFNFLHIVDVDTVLCRSVHCTPCLECMSCHATIDKNQRQGSTLRYRGYIDSSPVAQIYGSFWTGTYTILPTVKINKIYIK